MEYVWIDRGRVLKETASPSWQTKLMFIHMSCTWYGACRRGGRAGGDAISNIRTARREAAEAARQANQTRCLPR